jgi:hypothetical protein
MTIICAPFNIPRGRKEGTTGCAAEIWGVHGLSLVPPAAAHHPSDPLLPAPARLGAILGLAPADSSKLGPNRRLKSSVRCQGLLQGIEELLS